MLERLLDILRAGGTHRVSDLARAGYDSRTGRDDAGGPGPRRVCETHHDLRADLHLLPGS